MTLLRCSDGLWLKLGEGGVALRRLRGGPKLVGKGDHRMALLRGSIDPPLTGGSESVGALLRRLVGSHKLVGKGDLRLTLLCD